MTQPTRMQIEVEFMQMYERCRPYTMVDILKCHNLYTATRYVLQHDIPGDLVECGVWRGGCAMLMAMVATARGADRELFLFDTFAGMTRPGEHDIRSNGEPAAVKWQASEKAHHNEWCFASLDEVQRNMASTGYDPQRLRFVRGPVEETLPDAAPEKIAVLRLDTDFYESSYHELRHLYPRLAVGGVLILDDYHLWDGQRRAVQQYFAEQGIGMMLNNVSASAVGVKCAPAGLSLPEREILGRLTRQAG